MRYRDWEIVAYDAERLVVDALLIYAWDDERPVVEAFTIVPVGAKKSVKYAPVAERLVVAKQVS